MGITDLEVEQALQRLEARWQGRLDFICRQVNEGFSRICKQIDEQVNAGFALHREAIHHHCVARDAPSGPLAELQREIAALKASPPTVNVTVQHPMRAVQTVERDPTTQEITRTETEYGH